MRYGQLLEQVCKENIRNFQDSRRQSVFFVVARLVTIRTTDTAQGCVMPIPVS